MASGRKVDTDDVGLDFMVGSKLQPNERTRVNRPTCYDSSMRRVSRSSEGEDVVRDATTM